ncbi:MAG: hypothetical protein HZB67_05645, partial [Candidatus Aenigmarchaeota archaeon]|nr:hypothetical protein [Candidatus Aenigmarchaeota archaeon]
MKFALLLIVILVLVSGCATNQPKDSGKENTTSSVKIAETEKAGFQCENNNSAKSRGYVLLMGLADHTKEGWISEKKLMEKDPKAKFVLIYDQDENSKLEDISRKFLEDLNNIIKKNQVEELVIFGASAGGVTASYSIHKLNFSGPIALHTLSSPLKGYDFRGVGEAFLGERSVYEKEIALGLGPYITPGKNVKVYHHKTVTDTVLKDHYCGAFASLCDPIKIQNNNIQGSKEFYYPQYDHNPLMGVVIREVLKCYNPGINKDIEKEEQDKEQNIALGSLCTGEENCRMFCQNQRGKCTAYCDTDLENPLCGKGFIYDCSLNPEKPGCPASKINEQAPTSQTPQASASVQPSPSPQKPVENSWILPFDIGDSYDSGTKSQGQLSYAGSWVVSPFGGRLSRDKKIWEYNKDAVDTLFETVPGTILRASTS